MIFGDFVEYDVAFDPVPDRHRDVVEVDLLGEEDQHGQHFDTHG